jgi:hypothetical protein
MTNSQSIDRDALNDHLTPARRKHCLKALGIHFNGHAANADGEVSGLKLPPSIHDDTNASLSVNLDTGQVHDHGGHFSGDLFDLAQAARGLSFAEALTWVAEQVGYEPPEQETADWNPFREGREVDAYAYTDPGGEPLFEVVRFEPPPEHPAFPDKTFLQRRYAPSDPKADPRGYAWGLDGTRRVLYRLPNVQRAAEAGERVFVVEGEKDVHRLEDAGVTATCNPMGAGNWCDENTETLDGAEVVILPDNDEAGRDHAEAVAGALLDASTPTCIVDLPGLSDGEDVSDWLDGGGTPTLLSTLADAAAPFDGTAEESADADADDSGSKTQAQTLIDLAGAAELFHTPKGETYARYPTGGHRETARLRSGSFAEWLRWRFYKSEGRPAATQARQDAKGILQAQAKFEGPEREVYLRTARHGDAIYIDLGGEDWKAVEIDTDGWRVVEDPPVAFRRSKGMGALPEPEHGGTLDLLKRHIRLPSDEEYALLWAYLVQSLRPDSHYFVLVFVGEQGSGKTTSTDMMRALIDPSPVSTSSAPSGNRDLAIAADKSWVLTLNNLSGLSSWLSDALCRLADGGGFRTRRLHTDREEELFYAARPQILNGIDDVTTRSDLARRALVLELEPIPDEEADGEDELWQAFREDRPLILGAAFDAMSAALAGYDDVPRENLTSMAEPVRWVLAAEETFPTPAGTFRPAYDRNRNAADEVAVENDVVAECIRTMMEEGGEGYVWTGKTSELLEDLKAHLPDPDNPPKVYPQSHQKLTSHLRRIMPALRAIGIEKKDTPGERNRAFQIEWAPATTGTTGGTGEKQGESPEAPALPVDAGTHSNSTSENSTPSLDAGRTVQTPDGPGNVVEVMDEKGRVVVRLDGLEGQVKDVRVFDADALDALF